MFLPLLVARNAFRHKLRTTLTIVGIVVAITAFGLLRTIVDAWYAGAERARRRASSRATRSRWCSRCRSPTRRRSARSRASRRVVGELVRRRLHHREQLLPAVRDRRADLPRHVSRSSCSSTAERKAFLADRTGRDRRPQARRRSTAGRSATRSRCAARSSRAPGRSRCAASTTAPTQGPTSRRSSSTGTS